MYLWRASSDSPSGKHRLAISRGVQLAGSFQLLAPLESASVCKGVCALFCAAPNQWLCKADGGSRAYTSHPTQDCSNGHSLSHSSWSGGQTEFVRPASCSNGSPGHSYFVPLSFHWCYLSGSLLHSSLHFNTCSQGKPTCTAPRDLPVTLLLPLTCLAPPETLFFIIRTPPLLLKLLLICLWPSVLWPSPILSSPANFYFPLRHTLAWTPP